MFDFVECEQIAECWQTDIQTNIFSSFYIYANYLQLNYLKTHAKYMHVHQGHRQEF